MSASVSSQSQGAGANVNTEELFNLLRDIVESSLQTWNDNSGKLDPGVRFLVPKAGSSATELVHVTVDKVRSAFSANGCYNGFMEV